MGSRERSIEIDATAEQVFDLLHDYRRRLLWDPFLKKAEILGGATAAGKGVATRCVARNAVGGSAMETVYVTFERPALAAVRMTRGPWFLASFAASLRQDTVGGGRTAVTYKFHLRARPRWLRRVVEPLLFAVLSRETERRLRALKRHLEANARP